MHRHRESYSISMIDAKTELHEGRIMVYVDLSAQAQTGCVATKGTRLCVESGLSVLLKMNNTCIYILRGVQIFIAFILFAILRCYGNQTNLTFS